MKCVIGIDPGYSGGIAYGFSTEKALWFKTEKMPEDLECLDVMFREMCRGAAKKKVYIEKVGGYRPGNSAPSACKFSKHIGHIEAYAYSMAIDTTWVGPAKWMKAVCGQLPKDKQERKREIKRQMQEKYPEIKVTLWNADALGLMTYGLEAGE